MKIRCLICDSKIEKISNYHIPSVSSDCKPQEYSVEIAICPNCGHVQKIRNKNLLRAITSIYNNYSVYPVPDGGGEPMLYDVQGKQEGRAHNLVEKLKNYIPQNGDVLDYGCGNGCFLQVFSKTFPYWNLYGLEYNDKFKKNILEISGVKDFFVGNDMDTSKQYSMITDIHVLEHIINPLNLIKKQIISLKNNGFHFIQVPSYINDPFDLVILDHISHFSEDILIHIANLFKLKIITLTKNWTNKHIGWLCTKSNTTKYSINITSFRKFYTIDKTYLHINKQIQYLYNLPDRIKNHVKSHQLGIFGTSYAATWIASQLPNHVKFFVDESNLHIGKKHLGLPILSPNDVLPGSMVYMAFGPNYMGKENLMNRLNSIRKNTFFFIPYENN